MATDRLDVTPERIKDLAESIHQKMRKSLKEIEAINTQVRLLSINAQIEAARAGDAGRSFGVVAQSMGELSGRTAEAAESLSSQVQTDITEMAGISRALATEVRGSRLSDAALNNIDLIDRNLYERSCDVRWWATDPSLTEACAAPEDAALSGHASRRLGVILDAYTVYFDLVLCTPDGRIIANGRPRQFRSAGGSAAEFPWFGSAISTQSGGEFGFQGVHISPLVADQHILAYSCTVREQGESDGDVTGVLGILFRWDALAQTIVRNTPLPEEEKPMTRAMIVDDDGTMLADTEGHILGTPLQFKGMDKMFSGSRGFLVTDYDNARCLIAHAQSPGFETYATGWHSVIIQRLSTHAGHA